MKVIERYVMRRVFEVCAVTMFWTLAIVWTTQVLARIDLVTDSGSSALTFFEIATLILPSIIPLVLPFAFIIGVALTLSTMNTDSELPVIAAAGAPRRVIVRPIVILAALASIFSFAVDNGVDPFARQRGRELVANSRADLLSLVIQEGTFRKIDDGLFVQVGERLADGGLAGIFVADSREEGLDLAYYAKTGSVINEPDRKMLLMNDGVVHRRTADGVVSIIRFASYAFDLSEFAAAAKSITLFPKDRTLPYLFNPSPDDKIVEIRPQMFRGEIHRRLTEWIYPLVFALIALAVAGDVRSHRESRIHPLITAVVIAMFVRWLGFFTVNKAQSSSLFSPIVYAVPLAAGAVSAWFITSGRAMELPVRLADRFVAALRRAGERITSLRWPWQAAAGGPA